jgi:hypothetical protein
MGSSQRSSSNEAPQTNARIFLVTAPHLHIHKSPQTSSSNEQDFSRCALARRFVNKKMNPQPETLKNPVRFSLCACFWLFLLFISYGQFPIIENFSKLSRKK